MDPQIRHIQTFLCPQFKNPQQGTGFGFFAIPLRMWPKKALTSCVGWAKNTQTFYLPLKWLWVKNMYPKWLALANGTKDSLWFSGSLILTHTEMIFRKSSNSGSEPLTRTQETLRLCGLQQPKKTTQAAWEPPNRHHSLPQKKMRPIPVPPPPPQKKRAKKKTNKNNTIHTHTFTHTHTRTQKKLNCFNHPSRLAKLGKATKMIGGDPRIGPAWAQAQSRSRSRIWPWRSPKIRQGAFA